jgi:predicted N-acetyltransferase YhbS
MRADVPIEVRPCTADDIDAVREIQTAAFQALDRSHGEPTIEVTPAVVERQRGRVRHFLTNDPEGSWVATSDGTVVGAALALRREGLWGLSLLVVNVDRQSHGIGRR